MTLENKCLLAPYCSKAGDETHCQITCYAYTFLHGNSGIGGVWSTTGVPSKYSTCLKYNLPIEKENPITYQVLQRYLSQVVKHVDEGIGLYFYSIPNAENALGTGTGKTTSAVTILNEYLLQRVIQHVKKVREMKQKPCLFVRCSAYQNLYNQQFRGSIEAREKISDRYYEMKEQMKLVNLLVLDDIAIRNVTEAFENELMEIIDARDSGQRTTIYTSNIPIEQVGAVLGERVSSRMDGMTEKILFRGKDHRRGGIFQ